MCIIGKVTNVTITNIAGDTVTFVTDARSVTATPDSDPAELKVLGEFRAQVAQIWQTQGGVLPDGSAFPPCMPLIAGTSGVIYLYVSALRAQGTSVVGPVYIRGAVPPLPAKPFPGESPIALKYPDCAPDDTMTDLDVVPQSVLVTGYVGSEPAGYSVELLDSQLALPAQDIVWKGCAPIKLQLTKAGFAAFHAPYSGSSELLVWPTSIQVLAKPVSGGYLNSIELRDQTLAWPDQRLTWSTAGATITIRPTETGTHMFGAYSAKTIAAAELIASADAEVRTAIATLWAARKAMEGWTEHGIHVPDTATNGRIKKLLYRLGGHP